MVTYTVSIDKGEFKDFMHACLQPILYCPGPLQGTQYIIIIMFITNHCIWQHNKNNKLILLNNNSEKSEVTYPVYETIPYSDPAEVRKKKDGATYTDAQGYEIVNLPTHAGTQASDKIDNNDKPQELSVSTLWTKHKETIHY